jgi:hypothetical protein
LPDIDHWDHDKLNNNINNLRWISTRDNNKNRSSCNNVEYTYVDTISDEAIVVDNYGKH